MAKSKIQALYEEDESAIPLQDLLSQYEKLEKSLNEMQQLLAANAEDASVAKLVMNLTDAKSALERSKECILRGIVNQAQPEPVNPNQVYPSYY